MILNYWIIEYNRTYLLWVVLARGPGYGHAFTIIPVKGGKVIIIDPAGSSITGLDLWIFRIVVPEDIRTALNSYFNEWKRHGCYFNKIYAVFNNEKYEILNMSIDEFIEWLYKQTT